MRGVPVLGLERHGRGGGPSTAASSRFAQRLSGKKRSARAMRETRARSGHRPERSERATAPRVSPRVLLRACGAPASPGASACASRDPTTHARDFKKNAATRSKPRGAIGLTNVSLGTVGNQARGFESCERRFSGFFFQVFFESDR